MAPWIATVCTAIVGVVGIGATVWVSSRERRYRARQSLIEERRRSYIGLFACADRFVGVIRHVWSVRKQSLDGELVQALAQLSDIRQEFNTAMYELALSCPSEVIAVAVEFRECLRERADRASRGEGDDFSVRAIRGRLLNAMRVDLGHPELPAHLSFDTTIAMTELGALPRRAPVPGAAG